MKDSRRIATIGALWGAYLFFGTLLAVAAIAAVAAPEAHVGRGDFEFHLDSASFRGSEGKVLTEIPIRIANSAVDFIENDRVWRSRIKINVLITDDANKEIVKETQRLTFTETDPERVESPRAFQLLIKEYRLDPGMYWLSYAVEDLESPKISMVGLARGQNKSSAVQRVRLDVPEIPEDEPSFSDAWFVWDIDPHAEGVRKYRPNPARMYGLYCDTLIVYFELYLPGEVAHAPTLNFRTEIVTPSGETVRTTRRNLTNPNSAPGKAATLPVVIREDVTALTAGAYTLYLTFSLDGATTARVKAGDFSVAWDMRTWEVPRREYLAEARFLLGDPDFTAFQGKSAGEQEQMLDEMWKRYDPEPATGNNEAYDEFLERLAFINAHYAEGGLAIFSQRGEMYMRYGPPDDVVQDVIPLNYDTLAEAEQVIENPYHPLNMSSSSVKLYGIPKTRNSIAGESSNARYRPEDNTGVPYELWIYDAGGTPILERDRVHEHDINLRFLFVDRDGHGQYKLEKSSSISNK